MSLFTGVRTGIVRNTGTNETADQCEEQSTAVTPTTCDRQRRRPHGSLIAAPAEVRHILCCQQLCVKHFPEALVIEIRQAFSGDGSRGQQTQRQILLDYFSDHQHLLEPGRKHCQLTMRGVTLCVNAFVATTGISRSQFFAVQAAHRRGEKTHIHGNWGSVLDTSQRNAVISFLTVFIDKASEAMPNSANRNLPTSTSLSDIFAEYKAIQQAQAVSYSHFKYLFELHFPNVKFPKENRFGKCDTCSKLKDEKRETTRTDYFQLSLLDLESKRHRNDHMRQRAHFDRMILNSKQFPSEFMCLMTDGMDQSKTLLPHPRIRYSVMNTAQKLQVHVMGAILFGRSLLFYLDIMEYPHDTNLNLTVMLSLLWRWKDGLPRNLHVQLDNTCRENKNQYVMSYFAYLVEAKYFDKISVAFLMKGHTHAQIDQAFSRLSTHLEHLPRGCLTFSQFVEACKACYGSQKVIPEFFLENMEGGILRPHAERLRKVYAIREWLTPHMEKMCNLAAHHNFEFTRGDDGRCKMLFKEWSWKEWRVADFQILKSHPTAPPLLIKPDYSKVELDKLSGGIAQAHSAGAINDAELSEWQTFLQGESELCDYWQSLPSLEPPGCAAAASLNKSYAMDDSEWPLRNFSQERPVTVEPTLHPALQNARDSVEQPGDPVMPVRERPRWRRQQEQLNGVASEEIVEGTFVLLVPDMAKCVELRRDPLLFPWIARADTQPSADGSFQATWFETDSGSTFHNSHQQDTLNTASVLAWNLKLLGSKKLAQKSLHDVNEAMQEHHHNYTTAVVNADEKSARSSDESSDSDSEDELPLAKHRR